MGMNYWYEKEPDLLEAEVALMQKYFPSFKLCKLPDGRLYWRGKVNPTGPGGGIWDLKVIYSHDHPYNYEQRYGGTIDVYPVSPNLRDVINATTKIRGRGPPHVYYEIIDGVKEYFICTVRPHEFVSERDGNTFKNSSAASCISWACKWIVVFELWANGEVGDEAFEHTY